jgi:hypothetical protein
MSEELNQNTTANNVDESVNIIVEEEKVKQLTFSVYHWTKLKTQRYCCERDMIFLQSEDETGYIKAINCILSDTKTGGGELGQVRYIQFDEGYLKFQIAQILRDLLFSCLESEELGDELELIKCLVLEAIDDFIDVANDLTDNASTAKAIKPKDVTQALKEKYKP